MTIDVSLRPHPRVTIGRTTFDNNSPLALIAGPCQLEGRGHAFDIAGRLQEITSNIGIGFVYKTSFDKANRTSIAGVRGVGLEAALPIFADLRRELGVAVLTDIHLPDQCAVVAENVDALQVPSLLSRQTDLIIAAGTTGKPVNVKKGQFLAPWDMANVVDKLTAAGCRDILLTERGTTFGYNALVSDMRSLPIMAELGAPVIFDATHSVQRPGGHGSSTGGERRHVPTLARAAVAAGTAGVFIETHQDPDNAPSDGPNMVPVGDMPMLLEQLMAIDRVVKAG